MHDLKLGAVTVSKSVLVPRCPDFSACVSSYNAFIENFQRAVGMLVLPGYVGLVAEQWRLATDSTLARFASGTIKEGDQNTIGQLIFANWATRMGMPEAKHVEKADGILKTIGFLATAMENGQLHKQLERLLKSSVVEMWMAFEVLVGDMLDKALTEHKECFGHLVGNERKPRFQTRLFIRESYKTFFADSLDINDVLYTKAIDELSLIRNLLIHKAGIVDKKFQEDSIDATRFPGSTAENTARLVTWSVTPIGDTFLFDGELVMSLIEPVIYAGRELVEKVSWWLEAHKPV